MTAPADEDAPHGQCDFCQSPLPTTPVELEHEGADYQFCTEACRDAMRSADRIASRQASVQNW
jgi:YHS domain-containing protein